MGKKYLDDLKKEEILNTEKLVQKAEELTLLRRRDFIRDNKKAAIRKK